MLVAVSDALASAVREWVSEAPELRDQYPVTHRLTMETVAERFARRAQSLGMSEVAARRTARVGFHRVARLLRWAESPIERALAPWLVFEDYGPAFLTIPAQVHIPKEDDAAPVCDLFIAPQFAFARYRLDFAVIALQARSRRMVAVECDGAEFHDPSRDRQRDAYLASWGVPTVRASGAEIYAEPAAVSARVVEALLGLFEETEGAAP